MTVSVIIPTLHACDHLLDPLVEAIRSRYGRDGTLDQLIVQEGGTFAENCNAGAVKCTGDVLLFLNDDIAVPDSDWLTPLLEPFRDWTVAITGAKLLYPNGTIQHAGVYCGIEDGTLTARNVCWNAASGEVQAVTGAAMAIRRSLFTNEVFDPAYVNGYEDIDLCFRVRAAGYRVIYVAESVLTHHESQSGPARWANVDANVRLLQERWLSGDPSGAESPSR